MASKDKTSKTARVMNLLSKKADPAAEEVVEAPAAPTPPIVTSMAPDVAVNAQIKDPQGEAFEGELTPQAPAPGPRLGPGWFFGLVWFGLVFCHVMRLLPGFLQKHLA